MVLTKKILYSDKFIASGGNWENFVKSEYPLIKVSLRKDTNYSSSSTLFNLHGKLQKFTFFEYEKFSLNGFVVNGTAPYRNLPEKYEPLSLQKKVQISYFFL